MTAEQGPDLNVAELCQESFYSCASLVDCRVWLLPRSSSVQSQGLGTKQCQVWVPSQGVGLTTGIGWLLQQALCHHCTRVSCRQDTIGDQRLVPGLVFTFSSVCKIPSPAKNSGHQGKDSRQAPAPLLHPGSCVGAFSNRALPSVCGEQTISWDV